MKAAVSLAAVFSLLILLGVAWVVVPARRDTLGDFWRARERRRTP
jgi:hypothetical protein